MYVDKSADLDMAERILIDAKCQRMGVCNAAESLLVHRDIAQEYLPRVAKQLRLRDVELLGDEATCQILPEIGNATDADFATEFLGPKLSIGIVRSIDEAIQIVGGEQGYDFIFDAMTGALLYALEAHNLTDAVLEELDKLGTVTE